MAVAVAPALAERHIHIQVSPLQLQQPCSSTQQFQLQSSSDCLQQCGSRRLAAQLQVMVPPCIPAWT